MPIVSFNLNMFTYYPSFFLLSIIFFDVIFQLQGRRFFLIQLPTSVSTIDIMLRNTDLVSTNQELYLIVIRMTWFHQTVYYVSLVFNSLLADEHVPVLSVSIP